MITLTLGGGSGITSMRLGHEDSECVPKLSNRLSFLKTPAVNSTTLFGPAALL